MLRVHLQQTNICHQIHDNYGDSDDDADDDGDEGGTEESDCSNAKEGKSALQNMVNTCSLIPTSCDDTLLFVKKETCKKITKTSESSMRIPEVKVKFKESCPFK